MAAIFVRSAFEALLAMENSTTSPPASTKVPSAFQEKPAARSSSRARSSDRGDRGKAWFAQSLLPGDT